MEHHLGSDRLGPSRLERHSLWICSAAMTWSTVDGLRAELSNSVAPDLPGHRSLPRLSLNVVKDV